MSRVIKTLAALQRVWYMLIIICPSKSLSYMQIISRFHVYNLCHYETIYNAEFNDVNFIRNLE